MSNYYLAVINGKISVAEEGRIKEWLARAWEAFAYRKSGQGHNYAQHVFQSLGWEGVYKSDNLGFKVEIELITGYGSQLVDFDDVLEERGHRMCSSHGSADPEEEIPHGGNISTSDWSHTYWLLDGIVVSAFTGADWDNYRYSTSYSVMLLDGDEVTIDGGDF